MIESMWLHYIILITIYFLYNLPQFLDKYSSEEPELGPCSVLVLILSARSNYDKRQAIRKTWVQASHHLKNICYSFAIGRECVVPPGDRIDEFGCQELMDHISDLTPDGKFISNSFHENELAEISVYPHSGSPWYTGIGFKILSKVTLRRVGVHIKVVPIHGFLHVMFMDFKSKFFSIKITRKSCSHIEDGYCFQPLNEHAIELPKNYEAEIYIEGPNKTDYYRYAPHVDCKWVNASVIHYTFGKINDLIEPFDPERCSLVTLLFEVDDVESLRSHFLTKSYRQQSHEIFINRTDINIARELQMNGDIMYLPQVKDNYRNLPEKLLQSLIWIKHHYQKFDFVLKVDDDSYVDIKRINNLIESLPANHTPAIFGGYTHNGVANRFGKWAEVEYSSMTYPSFPTGAGYLLTESLVTLLVEASQFLKPFQGEDVSVAIWVESLTGKYKNPTWSRVRKVEIKCWLSLQNCPEFFIMQELTPYKMYKLHYDL